MNKAANSNQAGFTLIEILIAVIILAILTLPILSAFSSAGKLNHTARVQENCNAVGQLFSERMKSLSIDGIQNLNTDVAARTAYGLQDDPVTIESSPVTGKKYTITSDALDANGYPYDASSIKGDKYYVQVNLLPDQYVDGGGGTNDLNNINSYQMPDISDIVCNNNFVVRKEIYQYDEFAKSMLGVTELSNVYRDVELNVTVTDKDEHGDPIKKTIDGIEHHMYTQKVTATVSYHTETIHSEAKVFDIGSTTIVGDTNDDSYKNVYLFYNPFDIYGSADKARDHINIKLDYDTLNMKLNDATDHDANPLPDKKLNIYLVEQKTMSAKSSSTQVKLDYSNIKINGVVVPSLNTMNIGPNSLMNLYTNVEGLYKKDSNSVTEQKGEKQDTGYLYDMEVKVWVNITPSDAETSHKSPYLTLNSTKRN